MSINLPKSAGSFAGDFSRKCSFDLSDSTWPSARDAPPLQQPFKDMWGYGRCLYDWTYLLAVVELHTSALSFPWRGAGGCWWQLYQLYSFSKRTWRWRRSPCWWSRQRSPGTTTTTRCSQCSRMSPILAAFYIILLSHVLSPPPQERHSGQGGQVGQHQGGVLVPRELWDLEAALSVCFLLFLGLPIKTIRAQPGNQIEFPGIIIE